MAAFDRIVSLMQELRVLVVGTTGSGKTSLALELAKYFNVHRDEIDRYRWRKDKQWTLKKDASFEQILHAILRYHKNWVCVGNVGGEITSDQFEITLLEESSHVLWLDCTIEINLYRLCERIIGQVAHQYSEGELVPRRELFPHRTYKMVFRLPREDETSTAD